MRDFKEVFTPPFHTEDGMNYIFDSKGNVCLQVLATLQKAAEDWILNKLNGTEPRKPKQGEFRVNEDDTTEIFFNYTLIFIIRGWGRLTGTGGLNLPEAEAVRLQDEFGAWVVKTLNNIGVDKVTITKESKYFEEFITLLSSELNKNKCCHDFNCLRTSCSLIERNNNIEINREATMKYMMSNGGYCDCEIMMNVLHG